MGGVLSFGIGPLTAGIQASIVTDSADCSELQIAFISPNIFSTGLPSVDEMLADIGKEKPSFKFGLSGGFTMTFTNAPSVANLHGPTYSVGAAGPGIALEYNAIPYGDDSNRAYSGITITSGAVTPGVSSTMSNTFLSVPVPISAFDLAEWGFNGVWSD
jgi:hypothetical protein